MFDGTNNAELTQKGGGAVFRKIKDVRISKGMTQEELSKRSGVSRVTIIGLENGKIRNSKTDTLRQIAEALDMTMDALFFDEDVRHNEQAKTNTGETDGSN